MPGMSIPNPLPSPQEEIIKEQFYAITRAHARLREAGVSQDTIELTLRLLAALASEAEALKQKS